MKCLQGLRLLSRAARPRSDAMREPPRASHRRPGLNSIAPSDPERHTHAGHLIAIVTDRPNPALHGEVSPVRPQSKGLPCRVRVGQGSEPGRCPYQAQCISSRAVCRHEWLCGPRPVVLQAWRARNLAVQSSIVGRPAVLLRHSRRKAAYPSGKSLGLSRRLPGRLRVWQSECARPGGG